MADLLEVNTNIDNAGCLSSEVMPAGEGCQDSVLLRIKQLPSPFLIVIDSILQRASCILEDSSCIKVLETPDMAPVVKNTC